MVKNKKIESAHISLLRVRHKVLYEQRKKIYRILIFCLLQYGITEWLVDIQSMGASNGEKLFKKKFCSLKLTRPLDEFAIFDTRPQDFIVVLDDLLTVNMDPCICGWLCTIQRDCFPAGLSCSPARCSSTLPLVEDLATYL